MRRVYIYQHHPSAGARELARAVGGRRIRTQRSQYVYRPSHLVVNWGSSRCPYPCLNSPMAVARASNKLSAFYSLRDHNVSIPEFTTHFNEAARWLEEGNTVVSRMTLTGRGGAGIIITTPGAQSGEEQILPDNAPLYVKYVKKQHEYRVHVFDREVIDIQQKRRIRGAEVNNQIRNHMNGWVFARNDIDAPSYSVLDAALTACRALGLDFGAVDVIWNSRYQQAYVLEVNTAPGLEGTTVVNYSNAIRGIL